MGNLDRMVCPTSYPPPKLAQISVKKESVITPAHQNTLLTRP